QPLPPGSSPLGRGSRAPLPPARDGSPPSSLDPPVPRRRPPRSPIPLLPRAPNREGRSRPTRPYVPRRRAGRWFDPRRWEAVGRRRPTLERQEARTDGVAPVPSPPGPVRLRLHGVVPGTPPSADAGRRRPPASALLRDPCCHRLGFPWTGRQIHVQQLQVLRQGLARLRERGFGEERIHVGGDFGTGE